MRGKRGEWGAGSARPGILGSRNGVVKEESDDKGHSGACAKDGVQNIVGVVVGRGNETHRIFCLVG